MREDQLEYVRLIVLAVLVGVFAALGNLGFRELIEFSSWLFRSVEWRLLGIPRGRAFVLLIPIVLLSGGAAILILDYFFPGDVLGYGFPNFLEMVNLGGGRIKRTWIFVKAAGAALSLGSGASVGREGPIAQIGGAIGAAVAQIGKLSADRGRVLIAAGAGAGIATTFNAPIGGLLFAQEIVLLGQTELANLSLLVIATFSGVVTSRAILGDAAVFHVQPFVLRSYWEIMTYTLMGALIGLVAAGYIRFFHATARAFRRLGIPNWAKLAGRARPGRPDRDRTARKPFRRLSGYRSGPGRTAIRAPHGDTGAGQDRREQHLARMRRAGRRLRTDLLHRHDDWRELSIAQQHPAAGADRPARVVRPGRDGSAAGRNHARAADCNPFADRDDTRLCGDAARHD